MKIISVLLSLLLLSSVNEAMAEHWELVEKGDYIELYSDSDYYHQDQEKRTRVLEAQTRIQGWKHPYPKI